MRMLLVLLVLLQVFGPAFKRACVLACLLTLLHRHHNGHMFGLCRCRSFKLDVAQSVRRFGRWSLARLPEFRVALVVGIKSLALADAPSRFGAGVVRECDRAGSLVHLLLAWR